MDDFDFSAEAIGTNTAWLAAHGLAVVSVLIPHTDGSVTANVYGPVTAASRELIEALAGTMVTTSIMTAEAAAAHYQMGDVPTMVVAGDD